MKKPSSSRTSKLANRLILLLSLLLAGLFLFLALRGLDWVTFIQILQNGDYKYLPLIFILSSLAYLIRALRWTTFLSAGKKLSLNDVFWANMVGYLGNAYLPARAGEVLRSVFLGSKSRLGTSFVLATALAERLLDVIALVLIGTTCLLWQNGNRISPELVIAIWTMAFFSVAGLIVMIAAPFQEKLILSFIIWLPLPPKIATFLSEQTSRFLVGMRSLQDWHRLIKFILLTGAIWLTDAFGTTVGVRIISQIISIEQALILLSALGLSSAIPSTPGFVGVYQFIAIIVMTPFGFSRADALAYIIIAQLLNYIVVSFWGVLGLWQINRSKQSLNIEA